MKKKKIRLLGFISLLIALVVFYLNSGYYIKNQAWKYSEGYHVGDWLELNDNTLDGRTIKLANNNTAKIVFSLGTTLIIRDLKTSQKGYYTKK